MQDLSENTPLLYSLGIVGVATFACAFELVPQFNKSIMQMVPMPDVAFQRNVIGALIIDVFGCFALDRLSTIIFAPKVFRASIKDTKMISLLMTTLKVLAVAIGAMYLMRDVDFSAWMEELERQASELDAQMKAASESAA
jgi:uncharacterized protein involved in response to NO